MEEHQAGLREIVVVLRDSLYDWDGLMALACLGSFVATLALLARWLSRR